MEIVNMSDNSIKTNDNQTLSSSEEVVVIGHKIIDNNITRKTNDIQMNKSYVQILHEMFPNKISYVEEGRTGPQHRPLFRIGVHVNGLKFEGLSYTKQKARHEAAKAAITHFTSRGQMTDRFPYDMYDHNHRYDYYRSHSYHRYQPYHRLPDFDYRWNRSLPFEAYPLDPYFGPHSNYTHANQEHREYNPSLINYEPKATKMDSSADPSNQVLNSKPEDNNWSLPNTSDQQNKEQKRNDFTVDDCEDFFVEFDQKVDNEADVTDVEPNIVTNKTEDMKPKKERIILRVMSETSVNQNPVSIIHELQPNAKWVCTELTTKKHLTTFEMRLLLPLAEKCFIGSANTKKLAKAEAASKALLELYNISVNQQNGNNLDTSKPKTTVQIAEEPLLLKQDIANRVGAAVMSKSIDIWDQMNDLKKWSVLSAIVLTDETNVDFVDVICLTSGTKCVKGDNLSMNGYALNDCHAEVLARRSFVHYIYRQIEKLIDNNFEDNNELILERRSDGRGFRMKSNIKVNLFISTAPCGDSRVFSPKEEVSDSHPNRQTRGLLRAKIEGGEGTIPVKTEAIQTWDGILQGHQRLQFMSCSDKIAVWNVVGIQGALLSHLIEPIYLSSIVLASLFNYEHLVRALHGRLDLNFDSSSLNGLPQHFVINKCKVAKYQHKKDITRQLTKAPNYALNWIKGEESPEVVSTDSGRIHIENTISRLAKRSLFSRFCALLGRNTPVLPNCCLAQNIPVIYRDGKTASLDYQRAKTKCMQTFQEQNLGTWLQVPAETDLFRL